jgi:hypothetical protein
MDRIFQHENGSLYVETNEPCLKGVFQLKLVSPLDRVINEAWFFDQLGQSKITELIQKKPITIADNDYVDFEDRAINSELHSTNNEPLNYENGAETIFGEVVGPFCEEEYYCDTELNNLPQNVYSIKESFELKSLSG